ncbi:hypothetical protein [Nocardia xishanensis]
MRRGELLIRGDPLGDIVDVLLGIEVGVGPRHDERLRRLLAISSLVYQACTVVAALAFARDRFGA